MTQGNGDVKGAPQCTLDRSVETMMGPELMAELAELRLRRDELAADRDDIERQRFCAMNTAKAEGRYSDRRWFAKASSALAFKEQAVRQLNRRIQAIEARLGRIRRAGQLDDQQERERLFIEAARQLLPKDVYLRIWDAVHQLQGDQS